MNVLGHLQQGGSPSTFDRKTAIKMAAKSVQWFSEILRIQAPSGKVHVTSKDTACLLGMRVQHYEVDNRITNMAMKGADRIFAAVSACG